ncbi:hypothetical protein ACHAXT_002180 [Thalassiosira profunda]
MGSDAPLSLAAVRRRYPRLHAAFALLSDREREYLGDAGDDSCNTSLEAETGLLAQIACTDFAAPLDDPPADCPMRIDSDANKFAVFVGKCLEAAESGGAEEDAHMQLQLWKGALEDALAMPTAAAKFEHLLGWTAAGAHHGLHPMLGDGDLDANMALLNRASEEWRGMFEKVHRHGTKLGVTVAMRQFALRTCAMLKFFLREAKDDCGTRIGYTFNHLRQISDSPQRVAGATDANGSTTTTSTAASTNTPGPKRVTVTVAKPSKDTKLGLGIGTKKGRVRVNSIPEGSLFSGTDLEVGMFIETLNGESYDTFQECLALLKGVEGELTLVAVAQAVAPVPPVSTVALPAASLRDEASGDESSVASSNSTVEPDEESYEGPYERPDEESEEESEEEEEEPEEESDEESDADKESDGEESDGGTARLWEREGLFQGSNHNVPETIQYETERENESERDDVSATGSAVKRKSANSGSDSESESPKRVRRRRSPPTTLKQALKVEAEEFLERVNAVEGVQEGLVYDTCPEIVDKMDAFLRREGVTKAALQRALGNINGNSMSMFLRGDGQEQCGNVTYRRGYVFFEKLRILEGEEKSHERLENEEQYPEGFPLSKRGWYG